MIILARMLMPEHFGLVGMVTAVIIFAERFKDLGLSLATVQQKEITHEQVSALFWINVGIGILTALMVACTSWPISWFYHESRLVSISLILSISFVFGGLTVQHQALLRRQMKFTALAWVQIAANVLSISLALGLAWYGYGLWALVWKEVSRNIFTAIGVLLMCPWMPGAPKRTPGIGRMLRFGRDIIGYDLVNLLSRNLDQILIGRFWGAVPLGFYRQAYQLMLLPMEQMRFPIQYVAEPALSTLQNDQQRYRDFYLKIVSMVSFVGMPLAAYLYVFAEKLVLLLFGIKWMGSVAIFRVLALAMFIQPVLNTFAFVMVTTGRTKRYFLWGIVNAVCMIAGFSIGLLWGTTGVAGGYVAGTFAAFIISLFFVFRDMLIPVSSLLSTLMLPALSSLGLAGILLAIPQETTWFTNIYGLASSLLWSIAIYTVLWMLLPGGRDRYIQYITYPVELIRSSRKKS